MNTGTVSVDRSDEPTFIHSELDEAGLSVFAFRIYCHLKRRSGKNGVAWPGAVSMAKICRMGQSSVRDAIAELEARGMLSVERGRGGAESNHYHILSKATWTEPPAYAPPVARGGRARSAGSPLPGKGSTPLCPANGSPLPGSAKGNPTRQSNVEAEISKTSVQQSEGTSPPATAGLNLPPAKRDKKARPSYPIGCEPANAIELDLTVPEEVKRIWKAWQSYRTERHHATGKLKLGWTEMAARMAAEQLNHAALTMPAEEIVRCVQTAVLSDWKTFYLTQSHAPHQHSGRSGGARKFSGTDTAATPAYYETDLTGEIR